MGIGEVKIELLGNLGRAQRSLISNHTHSLNGKREKDVGITKHVMIEEVMGACAKVAEINGPSTEWNRQTDFVLFVAFAPERQEAKAPSQSKGEQRTGERIQRRRLVITAIVAAQDPFQLWNL